MNRREFSTLSAASIATLAAPLAMAQQAAAVPFLRLAQRQPTLDANRIEVLEFFAYTCSHCFAFEPALDAWSRKLPADVLFRRIPVAFREVPFVLHQKLYFTLEAMGLVDALHRKVFVAIHVDRNMLDSPEKVIEFAVKNGVDKAKFTDLLNSFGVATKARQAAALSVGYKIDGTPALGVNGEFLTSGTLSGGNEAALGTVDQLVAQIRKRK
jgi:thiol:disulfide interchange protein DsbA